jgi:hypothetical protein
MQNYKKVPFLLLPMIILLGCGSDSESDDSGIILPHCSYDNIVKVRELDQWRYFTFEVNNCNNITESASHFVFTDLPNRVTYDDESSIWSLSRSSTRLGTLTRTTPDDLTYIYEWHKDFEEFSKSAYIAEGDDYFEWIHSEHEEYKQVYDMYFNFESLHNEAMKNATKI